METETIEVPKKAFTKMLGDMEALLDDVESVLDIKVRQRRSDLEQKKVVPLLEKDIDLYLKKRGVKVE